MKIITTEQNIIPFNMAIVISRFNQEITDALFQGAMQRIEELNIPEQMITAVWVPGAIEIPITAQRLAQKKTFEAIICLGAVIRGETSHYEYVCQQVSYGCQKVSLENNLPIIFGVLTTDNEVQAMARADQDGNNKGREAIDAAAAMVMLLRQL